ncbi:hypothetical protein DOTSEDRAFT_74839 [Dothistroma septosporum NZE10]|uniref:WW domain-containing protein n=1 Tax=Dothistroma septosporum (strain NZE10 / CBS 128990) TaxID=675120 RepID=N1PCV1_DOTSN|nr:hypothetical protein DOTSEDRAFT_74839 [Dothistroma septosporum NZE10]
MSGSQIPNEAPPSYSQATGSSKPSNPALSAAGSSSHNDSSHLNVPGASSGGKNGIPAAYRRSMEDEQRPLPNGWVRTYDPSSEHQFFVDTTKDPPRSVWHHPYDDDEYLATLPAEERERIEQESMTGMLGNGNHASKEHMIHAHSDDEDDHQHAAAGSSAAESSAQLPPRPEGKGKQSERSFGRKLKDKVTGMTHEQREVERKRRAEEERRMYEQHLRMRQAMTKAMQTGQPQLLGKDRDGKDVYVEPPAQGGYYGGGYGNGYGYNPYQQPPGVYTTPNARYIRPQDPYARPGYGYGGGYGRGGMGYGAPLALGGGLLGGLLLGDLLF